MDCSKELTNEEMRRGYCTRCGFTIPAVGMHPPEGRMPTSHYVNPYAEQLRRERTGQSHPDSFLRGPGPVDEKKKANPVIVFAVVFTVLMVVFIIIFSGLLFDGGIGGGDKDIVISYSGSWTGAVGDEHGTRSVEGSGSATYSYSGSIISAVVQKDDDSSRTLTVRIERDGRVYAEESTSAAYGVASASYAF